MELPPLGRLIGSGKEADVFEAGDLVVKLYRETAAPPKRAAFRELAMAESGSPP